MHLDIELLSAYIDGEVTPGEALVVERHLPLCRHCSEELESLRWTVNLLREMPPIPVPHNFAVRLIDVEPAAQRRRFALPDWLFRGLHWATAATAVLTVLVFAAGLLGGGQPAAAPALMEQAARSEEAAPMVVREAEAPAPEAAMEAAPPAVAAEAEREQVLELAGGPPKAPAGTAAPEPQSDTLSLQPRTAAPDTATTNLKAGAQSEEAPPVGVPSPATGGVQPTLRSGGAGGWLRQARWGLAGAVVVLLGLTLWARRQRQR